MTNGFPAFAGMTVRRGFQAFQPIPRFFHTLLRGNGAVAKLNPATQSRKRRRYYPATGYQALYEGRDRTSSYHRLKFRASSGTERRAIFMKSVAMAAVMSATEKHSPARNRVFASA